MFFFQHFSAPPCRYDSMYCMVDLALVCHLVSCMVVSRFLASGIRNMYPVRPPTVPRSLVYLFICDLILVGDSEDPSVGKCCWKAFN